MKQSLIAGIGTPTANYFAHLEGRVSWTATQAYVNTPSGSAGTISSLYVQVATAPGANNTITFTLYINGTPSALTCSISGTATTGNDTTHSVDIVAGTPLSIKATTGAGTPTYSSTFWSTLFTGTTAKESLILGDTGTVALSETDAQYWHLCGNALANATESNVTQLIPTSGTIKNLYVALNIDPGTTGVDAYRFTLRKNGGSPVGGLVVTITADNKTGNDTANSVAVVAGDTVDLYVEPLNVPSGAPRATWGVTFLADTDGESVILAGTIDALDTGGTTEYDELCTGAAWTATESSRYQLSNACVLKKFYAQISAQPGSGKSYTFTARVNGGGAVPAITITGTATTGNDTVNTATVTVGQTVGIMVANAGTPAAATAIWGIVSYIAPVVAGYAHSWGQVIG